MVKAIGLEVPFEFPPGDVGLQIAPVATLNRIPHVLACWYSKWASFYGHRSNFNYSDRHVYDAVQGSSHSVGNYLGVLYNFGFLAAGVRVDEAGTIK